MTSLRAPVIAGLHDGAGTTTVATALHGVDAGVLGTVAADVLVCRAEAESLHRLAVLLGSGHRPRPLLALTPGDPGTPAPTGLHTLAGRWGLVTLLPHVPSLPGSRVAALLTHPPAELDEPLRAYATALRALAGALVAGGGLVRPPAPPPPPRRLWAGLAVVARPRAGEAIRPGAFDELDDDALEALLVGRAVG